MKISLLTYAALLGSLSNASNDFLTQVSYFKELTPWADVYNGQSSSAKRQWDDGLDKLYGNLDIY